VTGGSGEEGRASGADGTRGTDGEGGPSGKDGSSRRGLPGSVEEVLELLRRHDYVADRSLATAVFLALELERPLFLEGEAGVGKTEAAKVLARGLGRRLIRLQCYEGLDVASAVYEWDYARQMIEIRLAEAAGGADREALGRDLFSEDFLVRRPLLEALSPHPEGAPLLLIDELDRADEPFEAFLLEVLSDYQVTIPEIGVIAAAEPPVVVITSNRTREIHDALKRRCFYHWIDYPGPERELAIVEARVPAAGERLSREVVAFIQRLRTEGLFKAPGVAETLDWSRALVALDRNALDDTVVDETLGAILKYEDDVAHVRGERARAILAEARAEVAAGTGPWRAGTDGSGAGPDAPDAGTAGTGE